MHLLGEVVAGGGDGFGRGKSPAVSPRSSVEATGLIMGSEFTFLFWGMTVAVGALLALFLELYELIPHFIGQRAIRVHSDWIPGAGTLSVLTGSFVLRYVIVYAGQMAKVVTT